METIKNLDKQRVINIIQRLDFFKHFKPSESEILLAFYSNFILFKEGEVIIKEGSDDNCFYLLLTGNVRVTKGPNQNLITNLKPGEIFGEIAYLTDCPRTTSVYANEMSMVLKLDKRTLEEVGPVIREKIKDRIIEKLIKRLDYMNREFIKMSV